ncbi:MAG: hypothetical protein ACYSW3_19815, partial [Planctomycetota bacterium]
WEQEVASSNLVTPIFTVRIELLTPNKLQYLNSYTLITHLVIPICPFPILFLLKRRASNFRIFAAGFAGILEKRHMTLYKSGKNWYDHIIITSLAR